MDRIWFTENAQGGETILFSGRNDNLHRQGVALILKRGVEKSLLEWKPINERLIRARFFGKQVKMTVIQCYAPTNDADPEQKDIFYETHQAEVENTPSQDLLIVIGDLNAMVGTVNADNERVMGGHGYGILNENGERLVELCGMNNLVIGGTLLPHKDIHKISWNSPNRRDKSQIDHLLINGKWRRSLQDVRVRRGADVGSDHHLVTAMVHLKLLRSRKTACHQRRFDVSKLKNYDTRNQFCIELEAEAAAQAASQEQGTAYRITKQICKGQRRGKAPICSKQGASLATEKEQEERWAEHFQEVLNKEVPKEPEEEIVKAIKDLKNGKAPGQDQLNAELFKCHPELAAEILNRFSQA
ncbi:hypothetical protein ACROYT_G021994 [Oculina patagonica]